MSRGAQIALVVALAACDPESQRYEFQIRQLNRWLERSDSGTLNKGDLIMARDLCRAAEQDVERSRSAREYVAACKRVLPRLRVRQEPSVVPPAE